MKILFLYIPLSIYAIILYYIWYKYSDIIKPFLYKKIEDPETITCPVCEGHKRAIHSYYCELPKSIVDTISYRRNVTEILSPKAFRKVFYENSKCPCCEGSGSILKDLLPRVRFMGGMNHPLQSMHKIEYDYEENWDGSMDI